MPGGGTARCFEGERRRGADGINLSSIASRGPGDGTDAREEQGGKGWASWASWARAEWVGQGARRWDGNYLFVVF